MREMKVPPLKLSIDRSRLGRVMRMRLPAAACDTAAG
jgi:hypothetical protein